MINFDVNSHYPLSPQVWARMKDYDMPALASPDATHRLGQRAQHYLRQCRDAVAENISTSPESIVFCGSATEANALAILGLPCTTLLTSTIEHPSILHNARHLRGDKHHLIPVNRSGQIDVAAFDAVLSQAQGPVTVSIMLANNQTGVLQPIEEVVQCIQQYRSRGGQAWLHVDAAMCWGKIPLSMDILGVDALTLAPNKIGALQGLGILVIKPGLPLTPLYFGGGQERGLRPGSLNMLGIISLIEALKEVDARAYQSVAPLRDSLEMLILQATGASVPDTVIAGVTAPRLPNTSMIMMPGVSREAQLMHFDLEGFAVSPGSACSSGSVKPSYVLQAMGYDDAVIKTAIRISLPKDVAPASIGAFGQSWSALYHRAGTSLHLPSPNPSTTTMRAL